MLHVAMWDICIRLLGKQITVQEQSCMLAYMTVLLLHALTLSKIERHVANQSTYMYIHVV